MRDGSRPDRLNLRYRRPPSREHVQPSILLDRFEDVLVLGNVLRPNHPHIVDGQVLLESGDIGIWFLFRGRPYDVGIICGQEGLRRGFYVDALDPVNWREHPPLTLEPLVDLFLDLWIWPDLTFAVLDENELEEAEARGWIEAGQGKLARRTIHRLIDEVLQARFPPALVRDYGISSAMIAEIGALG